MRLHLRQGKEEIVQTVDENGEILHYEEKHHSYIAGSKEQFFIGYASMLSMVYNVLTGPEIKVYAWLLSKYPSETSMAIVKTIKQEIMKDTGLKLGTIDNALCGLNKKAMVYTVGKATYKMNPRYAFKGSTITRNKALKAVLEMECPHC